MITYYREDTQAFCRALLGFSPSLVPRLAGTHRASSSELLCFACLQCCSTAFSHGLLLVVEIHIARASPSLAAQPAVQQRAASCGGSAGRVPGVETLGEQDFITSRWGSVSPMNWSEMIIYFFYPPLPKLQFGKSELAKCYVYIKSLP